MKPSSLFGALCLCLTSPVYGIDFWVVLTDCKALLGSTGTSEVKVAPGENQKIACDRIKKKVKCSYYDGTGKVSSERELLVALDIPPVLMLWSENRSDRLTIDTSSHGAGYIANIGISDRPDMFGSKVCSGAYATDDEMKALAKKPK